jgi:hypothetical protein
VTLQWHGLRFVDPGVEKAFLEFWASRLVTVRPFGDVPFAGLHGFFHRLDLLAAFRLALQ